MISKYIVKIIGSAVAVSAVVVVSAYAATNVFHSSEGESGTRTANASVVADTSASNSSAVRFNAPTGGFQANCITQPSVCGYPDATNTGVLSGITRTNSGSITVSTNGAVIQNLNVNGEITVEANNVTIRNVRVTSGSYYPINYVYGNHTGLVIEDTEIIGTGSLPTACMSFDNYTVRRVKCSGAYDGFKATANVTIEDSYITGLLVTQDSHSDAIQMGAGITNVTIRHNTIDLRNIAGEIIQFGNDGQDNGTWSVRDNLFAGGRWVFNTSVTYPNLTISGNRFAGTRSYGIGGVNGATWTNNYYDSTGAPVCLGNGC